MASGVQLPTARHELGASARHGHGLPEDRPWGGAVLADEALHAGRHPDRELERDRCAHRQPDDVRALESAVIDDPRRVGGEQRRRDGSEPSGGAPGSAMVVGDHANVRQVMVSDWVKTAEGIVQPVISRTGSPLPRPARAANSVPCSHSTGRLAVSCARDRPGAWPAPRALQTAPRRGAGLRGQYSSQRKRRSGGTSCGARGADTPKWSRLPRASGTRPVFRAPCHARRYGTADCSRAGGPAGRAPGAPSSTSRSGRSARR
jgi:hypothetical protein